MSRTADTVSAAPARSMEAWPFTALRSLAAHWPEYLMEAAGLGLFMISACVFVMLFEHPDSPIHHTITSRFVRRALIGLAMGLTAIALIYSPWGSRSGAHLNPAVTLTFYRLGKIAPWDAVFYVLAQFTGGFAGVGLVASWAPNLVADGAVNYVATAPGEYGAGAAFVAEAGISFSLMLVVLIVSNRGSLAKYTGLFAGACVALFITFEAPISGMSMNPARTVASAILPGRWKSVWIYFVAPPLGMLGAAALYQRFQKSAACAKLHHASGRRCIFCNYQAGKL